MKKNLLLFLLLMLSAGRSLNAQVYEEEYRFPTRGKQYYKEEGIPNFNRNDPYESLGSLTAYTDDIYNCHAPLHIELLNLYPFAGDFYGLFSGGEKTLKDYCEYEGSGSGSIWDYWAIYVRLNDCTFNTYLSVTHYAEKGYRPRIFAYINSLIGAHVVFYDDLDDTNGELIVVGKSMFQDCRNLKYVNFYDFFGYRKDAIFDDIIVYEQDIFLGCTGLEVVRFSRPAPRDSYWRNEFRKIFHSNFNVTADNSPHMKAFVVPDDDVESWTEILRTAHRGVDEGWVQIIPESRFNSPKPQSVTINSSAMGILPGSSYQLTATVLPSNVYSKNVIWSSSDPAVATVSSTGQVTSKNPGMCYITATSEMDNRYWGGCPVTVVSADYVNLKNLSVAGHPFPGGFNANTVSYSLTVPFSTSSINISAEANNYPDVTVTGAGTKTLPVGDTIFPVTVNSGLTSHANRTYTIRIHRKSNDATLKSLTAGGNTLPPDNPARSITVSHAVTSVVVAAEATHSLASVSVSGANSLNVGDNTVTVTVTAEDGNTETYTITVHRKFIDATLKSFTLNNGDIPFGFNPAAQDYEISVSNSVTGIAVAAVANDSLATVSGDTGNKTLKVGDNIITATVTPEDGQPETYTIVIHRKSIDATLQSLTVNGQSVSSSFAPSHLNYQIAVSNSVSVIALEAVATYPLAIVTGASNKTLNVGDNPFSVTVIPEEGQPKTYTVIVHRKSADDCLQSLTLSNTLNGSNIHMEYNPEKLTYTTTVPDSVKNITLHAKANHSAAFVTGHTGIQSLRPGRNIFHITVTSEDGTVKIHPVIITVVGNVII